MEGLDRDKEIESVMIMATPPSRDVNSLKRKREVEGLISPSADAVSEKNLRETAPMVLARWKTAAYKSSSEQKNGRGGKKDGGFHKFGNRRRLQTLEDEYEEGFDERTDMGKGTSARNGSQANIRLPVKKGTNDPLERAKRGTPPGRGVWTWRH